METPFARKIPKKLITHNHVRIDNYYWLNQRNNPDVIEYLNAENAYLNKELMHTKKLQKDLYDEIVGRIKPGDVSAPYLENGYYYYTRFEENKEYPIHCRKEGNLNAREEVILDVNKIAIGHAFCNVSSINISPDNKLAAYTIDNFSRRIYTICIKDLNTGELLPTQIENTSGNCIWANDSQTIFYTIKDDTLRPYKILRHNLETDPADDVEIYHEKDTTFTCYLTKSNSRKYIFLYSDSTLSTEVRFLDADEPLGMFRIVTPRELNHEYFVYHHNEHFYIMTNYAAKNFRVVKTPLKNCERKFWQTIVDHRKNVLIDNIAVFKNHLVVDERQDGLTSLRIINLTDGSDHTISFSEKAYTSYIAINKEFDTSVLRFGYSSLTTPSSTYEYNMVTRERSLIKREEILGEFDPEDYISHRTFATAQDGTSIPISIVYKKDLNRSVKNPLLLYGYGAYGISSDPDFSPVRLSLLNRGFIYAIAHIRGGQDMGRQWYEDGKLLKKKNTFTDFIDCAEELINQGITEPEKLFAIAGSAGGLLLGAVINMRPDLWKGVVVRVPFVDVLTTMLDETIPLTTSEFDEWGNPKIKEFYDYMLSYSPYDNVITQNYPALFVSAGLHDSQVQYWEPAKWVAKLRELKKDTNPLYLYTEMKTGHSGASGRFERFKSLALKYAFILDLLNIQE